MNLYEMATYKTIMLKLISFSIFQGSKCSQTLYLWLVTGRIFFYLSPPTSKLNNNLNIYFPFFSDNKIELWFYN